MSRGIVVSCLFLIAGCQGAGVSTRSEAPPSAPVKPFSIAQPDLVLLVTGQTGGLLEVCDCSGPIAGGLSRRSGLVASYRAAFGHTLLVDSGDAFAVEPKGPRNEYLLRAYRMVGYDAVMVSEREWETGQPRLAELMAANRLPYLSTTVAPVDAAARTSIVPAVTRQWGDVKVAVLSTVQQRCFMFMSPQEFARLSLAPRQFADKSREFKKQGYVVIVVAHGDEDFANETAKSGLADLVIRGHAQKNEPKLIQAAGCCPILQVGMYDTIGAAAMKIASGKIASIDFRQETAEVYWPADERLKELYRQFTKVEEAAGTKK